MSVELRINAWMNGGLAAAAYGGVLFCWLLLVCLRTFMLASTSFLFCSNACNWHATRDERRESRSEQLS